MEKEPIKTLANCTDIEFLRQTNKIRKAVEEWLTATDIANIRKRMPKLEPIPEGLDKKQAELLEEKNLKAEREQQKANLDAILDAMLEDHPEETLNIIKLCCFVEPDDDKKVTYYLSAFAEMFNNEDVLDFFSSLVKLGQTFGLTL